MPEFRSNLFVLTGGPGSGKTAVIAALRDGGHRCAAESGRRIIREQTAIGGAALPWRDRTLYAEVMQSWDLRAYIELARTQGPVFFDRGLPDVIGYLRLEGLPVPDHMMRAARYCRYARAVFLFPPWPQIYCEDQERKQSPQRAAETFRTMVAVYNELGYDLIEIPKASVGERTGFLLAAVRRL